jgi:hypothetical protein
MKEINDGISESDIAIRPYHLLSTVCALGGVECPLVDRDRVDYILKLVKNDATLRIKLVSDADEIHYFRDIEPEYYKHNDKQAIFNRKRDLDVLQKLGLIPGDTRRARYLYTLLFERIETLQGICAYDTPGWEGCPNAKSGAYERIRAKSFPAIVKMRSDEEMRACKDRTAKETYKSERLYIRSHHLMCMACYYSGGDGNVPRQADNLYEAIRRIQDNPDTEIVITEGCCMLCDPCDGYDPETDRCVHDGGLIRDYKKDLDVFQKLGLMPGDVMKARELYSLLFEKIPSTRDVCGYGDGVVTSHEWGICGGDGGNNGYRRTIEKGIF